MKKDILKIKNNNFPVLETSLLCTCVYKHAHIHTHTNTHKQNVYPKIPKKKCYISSKNK